MVMLELVLSRYMSGKWSHSEMKGSYDGKGHFGAHSMRFLQRRVKLFRAHYKSICRSKRMNLNSMIFKLSVRRPFQC